MNSPEIPLHQANPELFKTYLLGHSSPDEVLIVKGVTIDDHLLKSELHIKAIIRFLMEASIKFRKTTAIKFLSRLRRRIRSFIRSPRMAAAVLKTERGTSPAVPVLYKLYPALFEQLLLEDLRPRPDTDDIPGITQWDRMLRIEIVLFILDDEIIRLCAYVRQQSVQAVRAEHRRKVDRVLAAYGRLLPATRDN